MVGSEGGGRRRRKEEEEGGEERKKEKEEGEEEEEAQAQARIVNQKLASGWKQRRLRARRVQWEGVSGRKLCTC